MQTFVNQLVSSRSAHYAGFMSFISGWKFTEVAPGKCYKPLSTPKTHTCGTFPDLISYNPDTEDVVCNDGILSPKTSNETFITVQTFDESVYIPVGIRLENKLSLEFSVQATNDAYLKLNFDDGVATSPLIVQFWASGNIPSSKIKNRYLDRAMTIDNPLMGMNSDPVWFRIDWSSNNMIIERKAASDTDYNIWMVLPNWENHVGPIGYEEQCVATTCEIASVEVSTRYGSTGVWKFKGIEKSNGQ